jgi:ubiquinone/menaquinone biosynthesis C-methylase UbiE
MADDNSAQIEEWNGRLGETWAAEQDVLDGLTRPFGEAAMRAADPQPGEQVIDIGCGCGDSSLSLARAVGAGGRVLGVDVSRPMLEVARRRGKAAGLGKLSFEQADASGAALPGGQDLLYSRFGVMFFAAPAPAFAHMRRSLKDSGRLAFVCWRGPMENPWATVPVMAGRQALGIEGQPSDPFAPGPFAFADDGRVRGILEEAGFRNVKAERFDGRMLLGSSARSAAEATARIGPLGRLVRENGPEHLPKILDAVEKALTPLAAKDGSVAPPAGAWVVTAKAG